MLLAILVMQLLDNPIALAEKRVCEVTGTESSVGGIYVEISDDPLTFQKLTRRDKKESFWFLFRLSNEPGEWRAGFGRNISERVESFKASGQDDQPPETGWTNMKGKGKQWKVTLKETTLASTLKETEDNNGSATLDGGAVCLELDTSTKEWVWKVLAKNNPKICDSNPDCMGSWDEDCLGEDFNGTKALMISDGESSVVGAYGLTRCLAE